jgi:hypothetical protein
MPVEDISILILPCEHTFSLMNFTANNQEKFQTNPAAYSINTKKL